MATAPGWTTRSRVTSSPSSWRKRSTRTLNMRPAYTSSPPVCLNTAQLLPKHGAPGDRGAEEQLVLVQRAAHRTAREAARAVALEVGHGRNELVVRQRLAALEPVGQGGGDRDGDWAQEEAEHRRTVVGNPAMARARVAGGHAGHEHGPRAEGEARVRGVERPEAAVPEQTPRAVARVGRMLRGGVVGGARVRVPPAAARRPVGGSGAGLELAMAHCKPAT